MTRSSRAASPRSRLAAPAVVAIFAASLTACGSNGERAAVSTAAGDPLPPVPSQTDLQRPAVEDEAPEQTLRRADAYFASKPRLRDALRDAERACREAGVDAVVGRYGPASNLLMAGAAYGRAQPPELREVASLGCYLGLQATTSADAGKEMRNG